MFNGTSRKFFICVCITLALFTAIGMIPATHRKRLLKPIKSLYTDESNKVETADIELSESPKVMVQTDDASEEVLDPQQDPKHPNQVLPVAASPEDNAAANNLL